MSDSHRVIAVDIPADIYEAAAKQATQFHHPDTRQWFDTRDEIATGMLVERQSCIGKIKVVGPSELSLVFRTAYSNHVRSILTMGETNIPPSVHFAAAEYASSEVRARLIDAIETAASVTIPDRDMSRLYRHLFQEAQEETAKAVEILRACLSEVSHDRDTYRDAKKFVDDWDAAGEPFPSKAQPEIPA